MACRYQAGPQLSSRAARPAAAKNGDIPRSPLSPNWQPDAVGRHDFNLKIDVGNSYPVGFVGLPGVAGGRVMKIPRRRFLHLAAGGAALPVLSRIASAQAYPTRPVRIVAGFAPGGQADLYARLIGQSLSERFGRPFTIRTPIPRAMLATGARSRR
jgi:hypothetical protein